MEHRKLEQKVRQLFEEQGFELEEKENGFLASNGTELSLKVFSSEKYDKEEAVSLVDEDDKVFADEGLSGIKDRVDNDVSILEEETEREEYETPSYEVIGDIAVINELNDIEREEAVEGILQHQNVKTILLKKEGLKGEFRVGDYEKLYGEETETIHTEFGCRYRVDPTKVYFSERFGTERKRIVDQIKDGENVLVMFAGVGSFAILAAKEAEPGKVVAVEKNPKAAEYLKENIEMNKVGDRVEGIEGDVSEVVPELGKFDRIVMPLPESADEFLPLAFQHVEQGGTIHYYRFLEEENWEQIMEEIEEAAEETSRSYKVLDRVNCGDRGPYLERVCVDLEVS